MSWDSIKNVQKELNQLQAIPVVGPVIFSPAKAVVSIAEIVSGLASGVLYGVATGVARVIDGQSLLYCDLKRDAKKGFSSAKKGLGNLVYSVVNFFSAGIVGACIEKRKIELLSRW